VRVIVQVDDGVGSAENFQIYLNGGGVGVTDTRLIHNSVTQFTAPYPNTPPAGIIRAGFTARGSNGRTSINGMPAAPSSPYTPPAVTRTLFAANLNLQGYLSLFQTLAYGVSDQQLQTLTAGPL
jgi:hypothetical protein